MMIELSAEKQQQSFQKPELSSTSQAESALLLRRFLPALSRSRVKRLRELDHQSRMDAVLQARSATCSQLSLDEPHVRLQKLPRAHPAQFQVAAESQVPAPVRTVAAHAAARPHWDSSFASRCYSDNHSCADQVQVDLPAPRRHVQDVELSPAVSRSELVDFPQHARGPRINLSPKERFDIEDRLRPLRALRTIQDHLHVARLIDLTHSLHENFEHERRQFRNSNSVSVTLRCRDTSLEQQLTGGVGIVERCQFRKIETVRQPKTQLVVFNRQRKAPG